MPDTPDLVRRAVEELRAAGILTRAVSSEDGSSLTLRSAKELEELLAVAKKLDDAAAGRKRFFRIPTVPPGVYE